MLRAALLLALASAVLGQPLIQPRINNGEKPDITHFPAQVLISNVTDPICGGTLVDEMHVLTTAACVKDTKVTDLSVTAGAVTLPDTKAQIKFVKKVYQFNETLHYGKIKTVEGVEKTYPLDDIVLIRLNDKMDITDAVKPIKWSTENVTENTDSSKNCEVSGWGKTGDQSQNPQQQLFSLKVRVVDVAKGLDGMDLESNVNITNAASLCIKATGQRSLCKGDEGSGIICDNRLQGIVSWGADCLNPYAIGVNIVPYAQWIENAIKTSNSDFTTTTSTTTTTTTTTTKAPATKPGGGSSSSPSGASTHSAPVIALLGLLTVWRLL